VAFEPIVLKPGASLRVLVGVLVFLFAAMFAAVGGVVGKLIAIAMVVGFIALAIKLAKARVIISVDGVEHRGAFSTKSLRWTDVTRYRFISIDPTANAHAAGGGLIGVLAVAAVKAMQAKGGNRKFKAGRLTLFGQGNDKVVVTSRYKGADAALDVAFAQLNPRLANCTQFGDLSFDGNVLRHAKKGELSIAEIDYIGVSSNGMIHVRKVGKRLAWATVQMARLDNPIVLFDRLNDRSVRVDMSEEVFLPHPTIQMLINARQARANLPKAVVHNR
jgi:hypothetical protein